MSKLNKTENIAVLGLVLLIITAIAGTLLGFVNDITMEPRLVQMEKAKNEALKIVLPEATTFEDQEVSPDYPTILEVYKDENNTGVAFKVATKGYGGEIILFVGIDLKGRVAGVHMLKHGETPGLGANANNASFKEQFTGKGPDSLTVVKSAPSDHDIQAISGATITSKAIVKGVNEALDFYNNIMAGEVE